MPTIEVHLNRTMEEIKIHVAAGEARPYVLLEQPVPFPWGIGDKTHVNTVVSTTFLPEELFEFASRINEAVRMLNVDTSDKPGKSGTLVRKQRAAAGRGRPAKTKSRKSVSIRRSNGDTEGAS